MEGSNFPEKCSSSENGSLDCETASVVSDCSDSRNSSGCVNEAAVIRDHSALGCDMCGCTGGTSGSPLELSTSLLELSTWEVLPDDCSSLDTEFTDNLDGTFESLAVNNTRIMCGFIKRSYDQGSGFVYIKIITLTYIQVELDP